MIEENNIILIKKYDDIEYIQFKKLLEFGIKHAYTLKSDNYNFSARNPELRMKSYEKIFDALQIDIKTLSSPMLNHTSNIMNLEKNISREKMEDVDGAITNKNGISLATTNADCILFLFYDPIKRVIANVHSGWRGTFQKIAEKTIVKMNRCYGSLYEDIYVFICPCIRVDHFEVDEDVKELCEDIFSFTKKCELFIKKGRIVDGKQKYNIDTVLINKILFKDLGIKEEHIIDSDICSVCNEDRINSYRAHGIDRKLATAIITLD